MFSVTPLTAPHGSVTVGAVVGTPVAAEPTTNDANQNDRPCILNYRSVQVVRLCVCVARVPCTSEYWSVSCCDPAGSTQYH